MNKQQLIEIIAEENEITKDMATRTLNTMIRSIMTSVKNGEPVVLVGFGTFRQVKRKARVICNPLTGEKLELSPAASQNSFRVLYSNRSLMNKTANHCFCEPD